MVSTMGWSMLYIMPVAWTVGCSKPRLHRRIQGALASTIGVRG